MGSTDYSAMGKPFGPQMADDSPNKSEVSLRVSPGDPTDVRAEVDAVKGKPSLVAEDQPEFLEKERAVDKKDDMLEPGPSSSTDFGVPQEVRLPKWTTLETGKFIPAPKVVEEDEVVGDVECNNIK
jgi:hypothetical protein